MPTQAPAKPPSKPLPAFTLGDQKCAVIPNVDDNSVTVAFKIDADRWARLKRKMGTQDPAMFLWENLLHRMIEGATYG